MLDTKHFHIVSPSGAIDTAFIDTASERLRTWGHQVTEGAHARGKHGRFAGSCEERLQDLEEAISNDSIDYILCSRGGYGLQQIIDKFDALSNRQDHWPTFIGFSDISCLHAWAALHNQPSLHGLMCKHLALLPEEDECLNAWKQAVTKKTLTYTRPAHPLNRTGVVAGMLIGGNLSVLYGLQGTPYSLEKICEHNHAKQQKNILFIEDIAERHYHIDRMMNNLRLSGVLDKIDGLIVGQFSDCEDDISMGKSVYETIREIVGEYTFPIWMDFPVGHVDFNLPIWLNRYTEIEVNEDQCLFHQ